MSDWQTLWRAITGLPTFSSALAGRIFLDLYNEPDGIGLRRALFPRKMSVREGSGDRTGDLMHADCLHHHIAKPVESKCTCCSPLIPMYALLWANPQWHSRVAHCWLSQTPPKNPLTSSLKWRGTDFPGKRLCSAGEPFDLCQAVFFLTLSLLRAQVGGVRQPAWHDEPLPGCDGCTLRHQYRHHLLCGRQALYHSNQLYFL